MPSASSPKSLSPALDTDLETKVAGVTIDALGRKWDPSKHPRDSRGRFIETGGIARVGLGGLGKVLRSMIGGKVEVQMQSTGERKIVPHQQLTMVRRPDGSKPTASVAKVVEEDAKRDNDNQRGDGKYEPDENPELEVPDEDPADEDDDNPFDGEPDGDGVPDAYTPSREEPREGDIVAVTARSKDGQLAHLFAKVDTVTDGVPDQITLADSKRTKTNMATVKQVVTKNGSTVEDHTVIPFEDLNDPAALMSEAEGDNGRLASLDNETATDLVEGHAKVTAPKPTGQREQKPGGGTRERQVPRPVNKDDLVMGKKPGTIEINGRIVGRIEKDPANPGRWKVTDPWRRTKVVGQKWDTGRTALANMLNNPPQPKGEKKPAAAKPAPAAPTARDRAIANGIDPEVVDQIDARIRKGSDADLTRAANDRGEGMGTAAELAKEEQERRRATRQEQIKKQNERDTTHAAPEDADSIAAASDADVARAAHSHDPEVAAAAREEREERAVEQAPDVVDAVTRKKAAAQPKATTRKKSATTDRTYYLSKSGNIAAVRIGAGQWNVYHRIEKPEQPDRFKHDQIGEDWYEVVTRDDVPSQPVVLTSLDAFRDEWIGHPDRDRAEQRVPDAATEADTADLARLEQEPVEHLSDTELAQIAEADGFGTPARANDAYDEIDKRAAAATQDERATERPSATPTADYDESDSPEGDPNGPVRESRTDVLGDVPAEPVRGDRGPDDVLRGPESAGGGADRGGDADASDAAGAPEQSGGRGLASAAARGSEGDGAGRSGVSAAGAGQRDEATARVPAAGDGRGAGPRRTRSRVAPAPSKRFAPKGQADLAPKGQKEKLAANLAALRLLRDLQDNGKAATPAQQKVLARWAGWGALPQVFNEDDPTYAAERAELKELLSEREYDAARRNTLNAHYTDAGVVKPIWDALAALGFKGGNVLEPGSGSGNFIGTAPEGTHMVGVELDPITAGISQQLYPNADIYNESFGSSPFRDGAFDAAIGNVPFGNYRVPDARDNAEGLSIHNHFINKGLKKVKPGGVMAVVTSSFTLDSEDARARHAIYKHSDLIGAVRLPAGTHKDTAGTDVVTDVLLFRKRKDGEQPGDDSWLRTSTARDADGNEVYGVDRGRGPQQVNDYFTTHPGDMLGTIEQGGYNGLAVKNDGKGDIHTRLAERLSTIAKEQAAAGRGYNADPDADGEQRALRDSGTAAEGRITYRGTEEVPSGTSGKTRKVEVFERIEDGVKVRFDVPGTQAPEFRSLLGLRDLAEQLRGLEETAYDDDADSIDAMEVARDNLRAAYNAHVEKFGPVSRYEEIITEPDEDDPDGERTVKLKYPPVMGKFRQDFGAAEVFGLEKSYDPETDVAEPADILTTRQFDTGRRSASHTDDPVDAIALASETREGLSAESLARILRTTPEKAREKVAGLVFDTPDGRMVSANEYLSDNVRQKWEAAKAAAEKDPRFNENVAALEEVLPPAATLEDVPLTLGAAYIEADVVQEFARHLMGRNNTVEVDRDGKGHWRVNTPTGYGRNSTLESETWGTPRRDFYSLLQSILRGQHRLIRVVDTMEDGSKVLNKTASDEAMEKAIEIEDAFTDWVFDNPQVADKITGLYTERHRSRVPRSYDGSPERAFEGMTADITLRAHQRDGVTRAVNEPSVLFEHVVGAGKTYTLAATAMELRRLNLAKKPILTVPDHMLAQWVREFRELYPNAKLLAADDDLFKGKGGRKRFAAMAANNDWDCVLMTYRAFESIPVSPEAKADYLRRELDHYRSQLQARRAAAAEAGGRMAKKDTAAVKQIEKAIANLEVKIATALAASEDHDGINFEAMGFDYVMVDEAHNFKNLGFSTNMDGVQAPQESNRARDMHLKIETLRHTKGENARIAAFATGTPVSNSLAEMYTMTRFMRPDLLEEIGAADFDSWAAIFAKLESKPELDTAAGGWVDKVRMRGFTDALGDGLRIWRTFSDTKTADDLNLPRPTLKGGARQIHAVEPTETQLEVLASFQDRVVQIPKRPKKGEDTHVALIGDGRRMAIDPRIMSERGLRMSGVNPDDPTIDTPRKIVEAAQKIAAIYEERKNDRFKVKHDSEQDAELTGALQMVMIDTDAPKKGRRSSYQMLKDELVALGVPADQIRFVQETAGSNAAKARLFDDARQGKVAVLMGSTASLGTGTNVQNRLYALHHLDGNWKPSDIEQREGRILRQGNQYGEVEVHAYVTKRTHDVKTWDMVAYKQAGLDAIANGTYDMRGIDFADDVDPLKDYDTLVGAGADDPLIEERRNLKPELDRLRRAHRSYTRQVTRAKSLVREAQRTIESLTQREQNLNKALAQRTERIETENFRFQIAPQLGYYANNIGGTTHTTRKDAAEALAATLKPIFENGYFPQGAEIAQGFVGTIAGFPVRVAQSNHSHEGKRIRLHFMEAGAYTGAEPLPMGAVTIAPGDVKNLAGVITRIENRVNGIEDAIRATQDDRDRMGEELEAAQANLGKEFKFTTELADAERRSELLDKLLTKKVSKEDGESLDGIRAEYNEVSERVNAAAAKAREERAKKLAAASRRTQRNDDGGSAPTQPTAPRTPSTPPAGTLPPEVTEDRPRSENRPVSTEPVAVDDTPAEELDLAAEAIRMVSDDEAPAAPSPASFNAAEKALIRNAVTDEGPNLWQSPMVSSHDDVARYLSEGHLSGLTDKHGLGAVWEAVKAEIDLDPERLDAAPEKVEAAKAARTEQLDSIANTAEQAINDGDPAEALRLVKLVESIDPTYLLGGEFSIERVKSGLRDMLAKPQVTPETDSRAPVAQTAPETTPDAPEAAEAAEAADVPEAVEDTVTVAPEDLPTIDTPDEDLADAGDGGSEEPPAETAAAADEPEEAPAELTEGAQAESDARAAFEAAGGYPGVTRTPISEVADGALVVATAYSVRPDGKTDKDSGGPAWGRLRRRGKKVYVETAKGQQEVMDGDLPGETVQVIPESSAAPTADATPETGTPEAVEAARESAIEAAVEQGATEEEAELAGDIAAADEATANADKIGETPIAPAPPAEPKTPRQLDDEKFPLTEQQQPIADAVVADRQNVLVEAGAGAGKTSTLEAIAKRFAQSAPDEQIAYVAFNKTVQTEAEGRMPGNVEPRTGHSIAWVWAGRDFTAKSDNKAALRRADEIARHLGVTEDLELKAGGNLTPAEQAQAAIAAVDAWSNSADDKIGSAHLPEKYADLTGAEKVRLLQHATKAWDDLTDKNGQIKVTPDHIRKMWALSKPDLSKPGSGLQKPATVLFLDEAQDTPPVLAKVIEDQSIQKVIVGDTNQAIYGFTGAIDYLKRAQADQRLPLTKSWRFGPQIADMGNRFLQVLGAKERIVGGGDDSRLVSDMDAPDAILVRSNGGMISEVLREQETGRIVGVPKGTKTDLIRLAESAAYLKGEGDAPDRMHEDLAPFRTWAEVEEAAEDDQKLAMFSRIIGEYGTERLSEIVRDVVELNEGLAGIRFEQHDHGLVATGKGTFDNRDTLKAAGFRWMELPGAGVYTAGKNKGQPIKAWTAVGSPEQQQATLDRAKQAAAGVKPDVVVSTAHKAKGLEWDRVRIGTDFRGPEEDKQTGELTMPADEELKLAYVAVTRAGKELDLGSLAWVLDHSDPNGEGRREAPAVPEAVASPEVGEQIDVPADEVAEEVADATAEGLLPGVTAEDVQKYTAGRCADLALSINEATGWPIYLVGYYGDDEDVPGWTHAVVKTPDGRFLDVEGFHDEIDLVDGIYGDVAMEDISDQGLDTEPEMIEVSADDLRRTSDSATTEDSNRVAELVLAATRDQIAEAGDPDAAPEAEAEEQEESVTVAPVDLAADDIDLPEAIDTDGREQDDEQDDDEDDDERRRSQDRRRRNNPNGISPDPTPDANGLPVTGAPVGVPLGELPLDGDPDPTGTDSAADGIRDGVVGDMLAPGEIVRTVSGRVTTPFPKVDLTSDRRTGNTMRRVDQWLMDNAHAEAEARGIPFYADKEPGNWSQSDKNEAEAILFDRDLFEATERARGPILRPLGVPREVTEADVTPTPESTPASTGATEDDDPDWVRANWNDGNPHAKPALGRVNLSPGLAGELRAIDWDSREADGTDPGYTWGPGDRFITVHDKAKAESAFDNLADILTDQASGGDRGKGSLARAAQARLAVVRGLQDEAPATRQDTVAVGESVSPDQLLVGDAIEGVLGSTGERGNLRVETATTDGAMDLITGRNDAGERDTIRIPSGYTVARLGTRADDGSREQAWNRTPDATPTASDEVGMLSTDDLRHGDVIVGKAGGITGRWQLLRPMPNNNPLFEKWAVVPEGRPDATPQQINLSKKRPVKVVARGDGLPEPVDANGFAEGELAEGDVPATGEQLDELFGRGPGSREAAEAAADDTDTRPAILPNGHLPNPLGLTLPADGEGDYSPEQIEFLSQYAPADVVVNVGDEWLPGSFEGVRDGQYVFRPATSRDERDVQHLAPEDIAEIRGVARAEGLAEPTDPNTLRPGTRVAFTRDRKMRVGVLEGVTDGGRAQVRDNAGDIHETVIGGTVRPVVGGYAKGVTPDATFAPQVGVWVADGDGWSAAVPGEWVAGIQPRGDRYGWEVNGATATSRIPAQVGDAATVEEAREAVNDHLYQNADEGNVTTLPGVDEADRDDRSRELAETVAELRRASGTATAPEDPAEVADGPEDIDGASAGWVPTGELQPGDVARVDGDASDGSATTVTGHVLGTPEANEVHSPTGGKPAKATRTPVGPDREGYGDRDTLLSAEDSLAARSERPDEHGNADNPTTAPESQLLSGQVGDVLPVDSRGAGVYPGSIVEDSRGRQGVVSEVWDLDASVRWTGKDGDERVRPGSLTVVQQARPAGWTPGGRKVEPGQLVTIDGEGQARVTSVSGDDVEVETLDGDHRNITADRLAVTGMVTDQLDPNDPDDGPFLEPTFNAPPSVEGIDVRPTEPVKPDALPDGTPQVRPNLKDEDREVLGELGLDIDATSPYSVMQGAARIRNGMPLSQEQALDLQAWLSTLLDRGGIPAGRGRKVKRLLNRLDAAIQRAGGQQPATRPAVGAPTPIRAGEIARGDMIAVPNPATGEVQAGTVRGVWTVQNGQVRQVMVEHPDGTWSNHRLNPDGEVFLLPDLDSLDVEPAAEDAPVELSPVEEDRPFTEPRVGGRLQDAADAVTSTAVGEDDDEPASIDQLAAEVAERLESGEVERQQNNAADRLETSLAGAGIDPESAAAAAGVAEDVADEVAEQVAETVRRTLADAEPKPGESDAEAAKRVRDRLRDAADEVAYDAAAAAAIDRLTADADGDLHVPPTAAQQAGAEREINDALRSDLFALADQLAALGNTGDAQALSDIAARLAGRPDQTQVDRAIAAAAMGRPSGRIRSLTGRIRGMFLRARRWLVDRAQALMATGAKAKRSWQAAVAAARAEWNGTPEVGRVVADAAEHLASGGDAGAEDHGFNIPTGFADRVRFFSQQLPDDTALFGRTERARRGFRGLTLDRLRRGSQVESSELTGSVLDRAADGGPGTTALGHHEAVKGIGAAVRDEVTARIRGMLPEFGDDPAGYVREAYAHAARLEREERDDLTDDELGLLRRKARGEAKSASVMYANARAEAVADVLAGLRPMGPQGAVALNVQGRSGDAPEVDALRWAERFIPTDWLASAGTVEVKAGRMSGYDGDGEITVAPLTEGEVAGAGRYGASALHGLVHHLETAVPGLTEAGWAHHWTRTSTGHGANRSRRGRNGLAWFKDLFPGVGFTEDDGAARGATSLGAEFDEGHYEWLPTAFAMIFAGADGNADDDLEEFMLGLLAWLGRNR